MKKTAFVAMAGFFCSMLVLPAFAGQNKDYSSLAGKKWSCITPGVRQDGDVKVDLEVTDVTDGQAQGVLQVNQGEKGMVVNFKTAVQENPNGLPRFSFKRENGSSMEFICDLQSDNRVIVQMIAGAGGRSPKSQSPKYYLDPVSVEK